MRTGIDYLTTERPLWAILKLSIPMIVGNLFQQAYTIVDSAIVGHYNGETALAAVGASYALTTIFISIAIGGGIGASVIISQHFGAKRYSQMKQAVWTFMLSFLGISILLAGFGWLFSREIMIALDTPSDVLDSAVLYLNIYFYGLPFLFMYNILSSLFNALGKSRIPLFFLIFSSLLNVILDWYMVAVLRLGIVGAAYATFIAQGISAVLSLFVFLRHMRLFAERAGKIFSLKEFGSMSRVAVPSILQQSTVSIGQMLVQSVVNGFGTQILAGFSAAMRIETLCIVPMSSIGNALSSYTAQNIGANKKERISQGYKTANLLVILIAVILCVILECYHKPIIAMFLDEAPAAQTIETGEAYLKFIGFFFCMVGFKMAADGILRGAGDVKVFTVANLVNLAIRVALSWFGAPIWGVAMVWIAVPLGWTANFCISFAHYKTGKWKSKNIA
jgi:putative MATE family efflux protein